MIKLAVGTFLALLLTATLRLAGQASATGQFPLVDPVFQLTAFTFTAPANWNVEGTILPPPSCSAATQVAMKAISPDGTMGEYMPPAANWRWGAGIRPSNDCLTWSEAVSARDYLTYYTRISKLGFVSDFPIPQSEKWASSHPGETVNQAAYRVRYSVNGKPMEAILVGSVDCFDFNTLGVGEQHSCAAYLKRWFAPLGKMDAMLPTFLAIRGKVNPQWQAAWTNAMVSRMNNLYGSETKALLAQGALAGAARMREHNDYMASMQAGAERRDIQFEAGQYQKQNNNDNYVDYILDCQRSYGSGGRVSSSNCPNRQTY